MTPTRAGQGATGPVRRASTTRADSRLALATSHRRDRGFNAARVLDVYVLLLFGGRDAPDQTTVHSAERFPIACGATRRRLRSNDALRSALHAWNSRWRWDFLTSQGSQPRFKCPNLSGQIREIARDLARRDTTFSHETVEDISSLAIRERAFFLRHARLLHVRGGRDCTRRPERFPGRAFRYRR